MIEVGDTPSTFVSNVYNSITYDGSTMPVLPAVISNIWSNDATVDNIIIEYPQDPAMAAIIELQTEFNNTIAHDDELSTTSENAVQNKIVTAALNNKVDKSGITISGERLIIS